MKKLLGLPFTIAKGMLKRSASLLSVITTSGLLLAAFSPAVGASALSPSMVSARGASDSSQTSSGIKPLIAAGTAYVMQSSAGGTAWSLKAYNATNGALN